MKLFDLPQARHFCKVGAPAPGVGQSLRSFHGALSVGNNRLREGTPAFDIHRVNLLHSAERWLLYAVTHYRRSLDMLTPACAPWAQVTLYYASFFSANAILAMFGGWVGHDLGGNRVVDVDTGAPGNQVLRVHRKLASPNGALGSHRAFWDFFYDATASLTAWINSASLASALSPVNGDYAWQIASRNDVNYDMFVAWTASRHFHDNFKPSKFSSLTGPLGLQFGATEKLIRLAAHFAQQLSIAASGLDGCGIRGARAQVQRRLASQAAPRIVDQSPWKMLA